MAASSRAWIAFAALAAVAAGGDLLSKEAAFARLGMPGSGRAAVLVPRILVLETNLNEGALFGLGQGMGLGFAAVSVVAIAGIVALMNRPAIRADRWMVAALGLIVGGIVGNLYDRLGLPGLSWHAPPERVGEPVRAVRDWIHFQVPGVIDWPIFNLADSWLVIGAGILLLLALRPTAAEPAARPES
ncbi:MAG: signal peptidase II [Planctomycetaceae bacterium]